MEGALFVNTTVGVCTEEVTLTLNQGCGQAVAAQAVVVGQCGSEHRHGDAQCGCLSHHATPGRNELLHEVLEGGCQQHVCGCFACVGSHDVAQQLGADDAACTPQRCDGVQLQVPTIFLACAGEQVHALCVRNELGCEECTAHILNELGVACTDAGGCDQTCGQFALCLLALLTLGGGEGACEHGLCDSGDGGTEVQASLSGPQAGALLASCVNDNVDQGLAGLCVNLCEHLCGDFDQVRAQVGLVPGLEDLCLLGGLNACHGAENVVCLADNLHIGVLDTVVDHLHEVARTVGGNPCAAGCTVLGCLRCNLLEHGAEVLVGLCGTAGHHGGAPESALFAAGDANAYEVQALFSQGVLATDGVGEVGVTAVNNDVALIEHGGELLDHCVDGCARLDHNQDAAGRLEGVDEFLQGLGADEVAVCAVLSQQCVGLLYGTVVQCHGVAVTCQVAGEVCAHDSKAGDTNLCLLVFSHVYKDTR